MPAIILKICQYGLIILSAAVLIRCLRSILADRHDEEIWAYIRVGETPVPVYHWESVIGKSRAADIRVFGDGISRVHAILKRSDRGFWHIYDVFSKGGVWVNSEKVPAKGKKLMHGDVVNLGGSCVRFLDIGSEQRRENENRRETAGKVRPWITLTMLSLLQVLLFLEHIYTAPEGSLGPIALSYATLIILEWCLYEGMRLMDRLGFEMEILAFYLTTLGLAVAASSTPKDVYKQLLLIVVSVGMFAFSGWWMRNLRVAASLRIPVAMLALALLALNIFTSDATNGAKSWLEFGGYSFQPSEIVKALYIYTGAATLEKLYKRKNLYAFIAFSAACVMALALIGDFGTALIFFITFLVISFMRSGSIATVVLAVTGAAMAGFLAMTVKPHIKQRFATWGHIWEDEFGRGYQQTHALSASASGGLIGKGAGGGWLKTITASNTDMVFEYMCEELGLIIAVLAVLALLIMAYFAVRCARNGRSAYYGIAACATASMLLVQMALNVFGSADIIPFTGVTFPFVSRGGSSLIACWMMLAYLKGADTRRGASFAVRPQNFDEDVSFDEVDSEAWEENAGRKGWHK